MGRVFSGSYYTEQISESILILIVSDKNISHSNREQWVFRDPLFKYTVGISLHVQISVQNYGRMGAWAPKQSNSQSAAPIPIGGADLCFPQSYSPALAPVNEVQYEIFRDTLEHFWICHHGYQ